MPDDGDEAGGEDGSDSTCKPEGLEFVRGTALVELTNVVELCSAIDWAPFWDDAVNTAEREVLGTVGAAVEVGTLPRTGVESEPLSGDVGGVFRVEAGERVVELDDIEPADSVDELLDVGKYEDWEVGL